MGVLIAIDGLDGSGKETQSGLLCQRLESDGYRVRSLSFPVYDEDSSYFVKMYLNGELGMSPDDTNAAAASMFFACDRYISYRRDWCHDYERDNTVIIANRYTSANAVHQLAKLPKEEWDSFLEWLIDFEYSKLEIPRPDAVLFLEVAPEVSAALIDKRSSETGRAKDIHELDRDYLSRCYDSAVYAGNHLGWKRIKCCCNGEIRTREAIFEDVVSEVYRILDEKTVKK